MRLRRWLTPGIGVKRWLLVLFFGLLILAIAVAHVLRQLGNAQVPGSVGDAIVDVLTLQFLPFAVRGLLVGVAGLALVALGAFKVLQSVTDPLRRPGADEPLVETLYQRRMLARGPKIVAIGGGTGLSTLLRGLKVHTSNLTAIVTVADDGGSSGALRTELGIPPVGDIRNCVVALADEESLMSRLLQYRFPGYRRLPDGLVETEPGGLAGHAVGNLLLAALTAIEDGDFEEGVRQMNRVLAVRGQVLPASPTPITLNAETRDGTTIVGQSSVMRTRGIDRVWISPSDVAASEDALAAIGEAELIILGPGSLYTSILPTLLIPAIGAAIAAASGLRVYVCNVATQRGETEGFDLADHVEALERGAGRPLADVVLANDEFDAARRPADAPPPVTLRWPPNLAAPPRLVLDAIVDPGYAHHHDPQRLAAALLRLLDREGGAARPQAAARTA
jgi:uncharacterized cofD-like protein